MPPRNETPPQRVRDVHDGLALCHGSTRSVGAVPEGTRSAEAVLGGAIASDDRQSSTLPGNGAAEALAHHVATETALLLLRSPPHGGGGGAMKQSLIRSAVPVATDCGGSPMVSFQAWLSRSLTTTCRCRSWTSNLRRRFPPPSCKGDPSAGYPSQESPPPRRSPAKPRHPRPSASKELCPPGARRTTPASSRGVR